MLEIVMSIESSIKQTLSRLKHSTHYVERVKVAKRSVLKKFRGGIDYLVHILGYAP